MNTCEVCHLTKKFEQRTVLDDLNLSFREKNVIGLIGLNGSGKTTLLRHLTGFYLPTEGEVITLGKPASRLGRKEFNRIGMVHQENQLPEWMGVLEFLSYIRSFYKRWDKDLQARLLNDFDLDPYETVGRLSPGGAQKLAVIMAVCHLPDLLILDEPASAMDPLARAKFMELLFSLVEHEFKTIVISSHALTDIEKVVDHIVCLHKGRVKVDMGLDELYESYGEWQLTSPEGNIPEEVKEPFVLTWEGDQRAATLKVDTSRADPERFRRKYGLQPKVGPMNLEGIFPLMIKED